MKKFLFLIIALLCTSMGYSQNVADSDFSVTYSVEFDDTDDLARVIYPLVTITGTITDKYTGEPVPFVLVSIYRGINLVDNTTTDLNGNFKMKLSPGIYRIEFLFVGYGPLSQTIHVTSDGYVYYGALVPES